MFSISNKYYYLFVSTQVHYNFGNYACVHNRPRQHQDSPRSSIRIGHMAVQRFRFFHIVASVRGAFRNCIWRANVRYRRFVKKLNLYNIII